MDTNYEVLVNIPAFQQLSPMMLERVTQDSATVAFQPGQIICEQGDDLTGLYAVVSGYVKLYRQSRDRVQILALLKAGDCFGIESLSENVPSPYHVAAITEVAAIHLPTSLLRKLLRDDPNFRVALLELVSVRLRQFASLVHNLAFRDVTSRLAVVLVARAEAEGEQTPDGIRIPRLMTQSELATMVGTGREVVQRTFKKFQNG